MTSRMSIDMTARIDGQPEQASPDMLRSMLPAFAEALMGAQADAECGAQHGQRSLVRRSSGSAFPEWLPSRRSRAESALITDVACACVQGVSTRRLKEISAQHQARGSRESDLVHHFRGRDPVCVQR